MRFEDCIRVCSTDTQLFFSRVILLTQCVLYTKHTVHMSRARTSYRDAMKGGELNMSGRARRERAAAAALQAAEEKAASRENSVPEN